ncbi:MAG: hypothetical protein ACYDBQ_07640 [Thermoplasmatota archaeon]
MRFAVALFVVALLAGCAQHPAPAASSAPSPPPLLAPTWNVGDWWNYTSDDGPATYVVSGATAADYIMDTDSRSLAFFNALSDVSTLGPIRKSDLAGSQGATRVEFFHWPLEDKASWNTTWDGLAVTIVSHQVAPGSFTFTAARSNGTRYASYAYDNATRWMRHVVFYDPSGAPSFHFDLAAMGTGYGGSLVRWNVSKIDEQHGSPTAAFTGFPLPADGSEVYVSYAISCTQGAIYLEVGPLDQSAAGQGVSKNVACPGTASFAGSLGSNPGTQAQNWGVAHGDAPQATQGTLDDLVLVRKAFLFTAGKAPPLG